MDINETIKQCNLCGELPKLTESSIQVGTSPFIIIGESPANDGWIKSKKAFYNVDGKLQASGKVLEKLLKILGFKISEIYFTECCKCIISDRKKLEKCTKNCMPILLKQLLSVPCNIIITMGVFPTQAILQTKIKRFSDVVGKVFDFKIENKNYKLIPIYHPSPLNPKGFKDNVPIFENIKVMLENNTK